MRLISVVLYASKTKLTDNHNEVKTDEGRVLFIRAQEVNGDVGTALDQAQPLEGETVLNSVPFRVA